ncbi:hypothetical protein EYF80_036817 [Liparis tanakae]|uniref:Uncharacterized protein n=1 Tax=Liparis tanakae TaxID=230148 RepID=A0A4Z2GJN5_9TELE|nr:hypothetical protein EYF80_036817 [Liparis tanakae]
MGSGQVHRMNSQAGRAVQLEEERPSGARAAAPQPSGYVTLIMSQLQEPRRPPSGTQEIQLSAF